MNKELNEKLAKWAGITQAQMKEWVMHPTGEEISVEGKPLKIYPNFTSSLDACFKWLVPNLEASGSASVFRGIEFNVGDIGEKPWQCILFAKNGHDYTEGYADTPALALCKAIEKLIDKRR